MASVIDLKPKKAFEKFNKEDLLAKNAKLEVIVSSLRAEREELAVEIGQLRKENEKLDMEVDDLFMKNSRLFAETEEYQNKIKELMDSRSSTFTEGSLVISDMKELVADLKGAVSFLFIYSHLFIFY